jgi:hypothetical protein
VKKGKEKRHLDPRVEPEERARIARLADHTRCRGRVSRRQYSQRIWLGTVERCDWCVAGKRALHAVEGEQNSEVHKSLSDSC